MDSVIRHVALYIGVLPYSEFIPTEDAHTHAGVDKLRRNHNKPRNYKQKANEKVKRKVGVYIVVGAVAVEISNYTYQTSSR